jgi:hypothetical protein
MGRKTYTAEQIINKLREAEVLLSQGATVGESSKKIGVTEQRPRNTDHHTAEVVREVALWCPQANSNRCFQLERLVS